MRARKALKLRSGDEVIIRARLQPARVITVRTLKSAGKKHIQLEVETLDSKRYRVVSHLDIA